MNQIATVSKANEAIAYKPLGEPEVIDLSVPILKALVVTPTKSGAVPSDLWLKAAVQKCKFMGLNPYQGDVYIVGYDSKDGPSFTFLTSINVYYKRAELNPQFNGIESGVIVDIDGEIHELVGDFIPSGAVLVGGWAIVHRKDRSYPIKERLALSVYHSGKSRWNADPAGMICKCAEAAALRRSFPSTFSGTLMEYEMDKQTTIEGAYSVVKSEPEPPRIEQTKSQALATAAKSRRGKPTEQVREPEPEYAPPQQEPEPQPEQPTQPTSSPSSEGESEAWGRFKDMLSKCKPTASDYRRLLDYACVKKKLGLSDSELMDADNTISAMIDQLNEGGN